MRSYFLAVLAMVLFGLTPVLIKYVQANVYTIGVVRLSIAVVLTWLFLNNKVQLKGLKRKQWRALILIGLFFSLHWITYFLSIKIASATIGIVGLSTFGIHLILFGWIAGTKIPRWYDFSAIALAIAGNYVLLPALSFENEDVVGLCVAVLSAMFFAVLPIFQQKNKDLNNATRAFGQYAFALVFFLFTLPWVQWDLGSHDWWGLLVLGIVCTFGAHTLWLKATTELPTTFTSVIYYLAIPMTMVMSYYFLEERITTNKIIGASLIVLGNLMAIVFPILKNYIKKDQV